MNLKIFFLFFFIFHYILDCCGQFSNSTWYYDFKKVEFQPDGIKFKKTNIKTSNSGQFVLTDCNGNLILLALTNEGCYNSLEKEIKGNIPWRNNNESFIDGFFYPKSNDSVVIFHDYFNNRKPEFGYTIIDLNKDSGRGEILINNKKILSQRNPNLTIIKHKNSIDFWILATIDSNTVNAYKFTEKGLDTIPVVSKGYFNNYIKSNVQNSNFWCPFTPTWDSKQIIVTGITKYLHPTAMALLYDFDNSTGKISNPQELFKHTDILYPNYCTQNAAISLNDSFIYFGVIKTSSNSVGDKGYFYQVNRFSKKKKIIKTQIVTLFSSPDLGFYSTTLAPDGNIYTYSNYTSKLNNNQPLAMIDAPNIEGIACNFKYIVTDSNLNWTFSKPHLLNYKVPTYFDVNNQINPCADTTVIRLGGDTAINKLILRFGDGDTLLYTGPFTAKLTFKHYYKTEGLYALKMLTWNSECNNPRYYSDSITIYKPARLLNSQISHKPTCLGDTISIKFKANNQYRYAVNWGYPKPSGGMYDTSLKTLTDTAIFSFYYPASSQTYKLLLSVNNLKCTTNIADSIIPISHPYPFKKFSISKDSVCALENLTLNDSSSLWRKNSITWFNQTDTFSGSNLLSFSKQIPNSKTPQLESILIQSVNQQGCAIFDTLQLFVKPQPVGFLQCTDSIICSQQQSLKVSVLKSFNPTLSTWKLSDGLETKTDSVWNKFYTQTGNYHLTLIASAPSGCADTSKLPFTVSPKPKAGFTTNHDTLCSRFDTLILTNTASIVGDSITKQLFAIGKTDTSTNNIISRTFSAPGKYPIYQFVGTTEGCFDTLSSIITVNESPSAAFHLLNNSICASEPLIAISDSAKTNEFGYWQVPKLGLKVPFTGTGNNQSFTLNASQTQSLFGVYPVRFVVFNASNCLDSSDQSITIFRRPIANFPTVAFCERQPTALTSTTVLGDAPLLNLLWQSQPGSQQGKTATFNYPSAGNYPVKLIVNDTHGCMDSITKNITVKPSPLPSIQWSPFRLNDGPTYSYIFTASPSGLRTYQWNFEEAGLLTGQQVFPIFNNLRDSLKAQLTVTGLNGCTADTSLYFHMKAVTGFYFPNSITANHDGLNEGFGIAGPELLKDYELIIYNKWGNIVFRTTNPYQLWAPENPIPGVYAYYCKATDVYNRYKEVKSTFLLIK